MNLQLLISTSLPKTKTAPHLASSEVPLLLQFIKVTLSNIKGALLAIAEPESRNPFLIIKFFIVKVPLPV